MVRIHAAYFPAGDEFSLVVSSTRFFHPHIGEWFSHGFSGYFSPYPDLSLPNSNFLRPVANITYFLDSVVFGRHWSYYLWGNYLIEMALVVTVWYLARICFRLPAPVSLLITISAALSQAFSYQAIFRPSFAFDLLGALWALLALLSLLRQHWLLAWLFVLLAVLTKESAYYVAVAASAATLLLLWRLPLVQKFSRSAAYLVPLLLVVVLRKLDFEGGQGVYVLNELAGANPVKRIVLSLTHWPYLLPGEQHVFAFSAHNLFSLLLTATIWILLLILCVHALRGDRNAVALNELLTEPSVANTRILIIFLAGSLLLPLGLDLGPRFGASTTPLLFLCLGNLAATVQRSLLVKVVSIVVLAVTFIADAASFVDALTGSPMHREQALWARSRNMVDLLSREQEPVVFLVGDATESFSSPYFVQRFAGYHGTIVPVSNLGVGDCPREELTVTPESDSVYYIHSVDACGGNRLSGTFHMTAGPIRTFIRLLPQANVTYSARKGGWKDGQFSSEDLDIRIAPKIPSFAIVYPVSEKASSLVRISSASSKP